MVLKCEEVWRRISDYLDGDADPSTKAAMEGHFATCRHCRAILDGTRNVVKVYGDDKLFALPANFCPRLHGRLTDDIGGSRGTARHWVISLAAVAAVAAMIVLAGARDRGSVRPLSVMSQPAGRIPNRLVAVTDDGRIFHAPGCRFIHGKTHMMPAAEAIREGYTPCVRCMGELLQMSAEGPPDKSPANARARELSYARFRGER